MFKSAENCALLLNLTSNVEKIMEACHGVGLLDAGFTLIIRRSAFTPDGMISEAMREAVIAEAVQMIKHWQRGADMPADLRVGDTSTFCLCRFSLSQIRSGGMRIKKQSAF